VLGDRLTVAGVETRPNRTRGSSWNDQFKVADGQGRAGGGSSDQAVSVTLELQLGRQTNIAAELT
jgi:hypothetical protein